MNGSGCHCAQFKTLSHAKQPRAPLPKPEPLHSLNFTATRSKAGTQRTQGLTQRRKQRRTLTHVGLDSCRERQALGKHIMESGQFTSSNCTTCFYN
ncbi:hypothetical protein WMY93_009745 [Mugilogobius chulae]|uniref:Uncharacterized protein n=1 Tax=Mugilogobius chulae TaxID=88201 RepID=A0AAW0PLG9_9GOBI